MNIDAKILLPQAQNFSESWLSYYPKILRYGQKSKDNNVKQFMKIVRTNTEASKIIALIILSYMFSGSRTKKSATKTTYRCSKIKSHEKFVAYFKFNYSFLILNKLKILTKNKCSNTLNT